MKTFTDLDRMVEQEVAKLNVNLPVKCDFWYARSYPGKGQFHIEGVFNDAEFMYQFNYGGVESLRMLKDGDSIQVDATDGSCDYLCLNDRKYHCRSALINLERVADRLRDEALEHPDPAKLEFRAERQHAIEVGERLLSGVRNYLSKVAPELMKLVKGYYDRSLFSVDQNPNLRPNDDIFRKFGIS